MNYGSVLDANYAQFSDDEKLNYGLKIALSRLQTELNRAWYQEPKDFAPKGPESIYKNKLPSYADIAGYYLIDPFCTVNGSANTSVITDVTVGDILNNSNNASGWGFGDTNGSKNFYNTSGNQSVRNNSTNITNTSIAQQGLSYRMFTRYRYWENGLTGKNSNTDGTAGISSGGTNSDKTEPENAIVSYVENSLSSTRTWKAYNDNLGKENSENQFFTKLTTYSSPIKIIHLDNINTNDYTDITKAHPFLEIYIQVPTVSTRQGADTANTSSSGNANGTDNIGFFNPILRQSLGDVEGYKYVIRGWAGSQAKWGDLTIESGATNNTNILYFLNNPGFILCYGVKDIVNGLNLSYKYPPLISFLRYTGETFSDGIISQGDTLPAVEVSNDKDLFINTTYNTIHRFDSGTQTWVGIGGSGGFIRNIYSQILDISSNSLNSEEARITDLNENELLDIQYQVNNNTKQLIIDYRFFVSFIEENTEIISDISGIEFGVDALFEIYLEVDGSILENTRQFVHLNIHEKYVTFKTVLNISDDLIIKNIITADQSLSFQIYIKSHSARSFKLHKTQDNISRPANLKITSIGTQGDENNSEKNIKKYYANNRVIDSPTQINDSKNYQITEVILTDHYINSNITELDIHYRPYVHFDSSTSDNEFNLTDVIIKYNIKISIDGGAAFESIGEEFKRIQYFDNYVDFFIKKKYSEPLLIDSLSVEITLTSVLSRNINIHKNDKPPQLEVISYGSFDKNVKSNQVLEYITSNLNGSIVEPNNRSHLNVKNVNETVTIGYSGISINNNISDISNNWNSFDIIDDYIPPVNTKKIILKYGLFLTYSKNFDYGIRGNNNNQGYIEWVYAIGDNILPMTLRRDFIDLTENYCFNETIIDLGTSTNISYNELFSWTNPKSIKLYARCFIDNSNYNVIAHKSQIDEEDILKEPYFEIICIGDYSEPSSSLVSSDTTSDDRIKHNEQNITNALNIIEKLQPKKYIKTEILFDKNHNFELNEDDEPINFNEHYATETGLIAQDIYNISELKYLVGGYELDSSGALIEDKYNPLTVRYNDIFVYSIQAIKELKQENDTLKSKLIAMEDKIQSLAEKIN